MYPNLSLGKSEVVVSLGGGGSRTVRVALLSDKEPSVLLASKHWPNERLRVVSSYKHLGGVLHFRGSLEKGLVKPGAPSKDTEGLSSVTCKFRFCTKLLCSRP